MNMENVLKLNKIKNKINEGIYYLFKIKIKIKFNLVINKYYIINVIPKNINYILTSFKILTIIFTKNYY